MMRIALIDYGTGNLHSLGKALEAGGASVHVESELNRPIAADALVLPGVGSFGAAAEHLADGGLAVQAAIDAGMPCLGICLGMQLLFHTSEEGPGIGLGMLNGRTRRLAGRRLPHMGWNDVAMMQDALFAGMDHLVVYFANSYAVEPEDDGEVIGWAQHEGRRFPAAVRRGNVWGVQFHPEKSGAQGLRVLRNFLHAAAR